MYSWVSWWQEEAYEYSEFADLFEFIPEHSNHCEMEPVCSFIFLNLRKLGHPAYPETCEQVLKTTNSCGQTVLLNKLVQSILVSTNG